MKFVLLAVLGLIVVAWLLRSKKVSNDASAPRDADPADTASIEPMVQCAHCQIHLPASESIADLSNTAVFCSEEHRRLGAVRR